MPHDISTLGANDGVRCQHLAHVAVLAIVVALGAGQHPGDPRRAARRRPTVGERSVFNQAPHEVLGEMKHVSISATTSYFARCLQGDRPKALPHRPKRGLIQCRPGNRQQPHFGHRSPLKPQRRNLGAGIVKERASVRLVRDADLDRRPASAISSMASACSIQQRSGNGQNNSGDSDRIVNNPACRFQVPLISFHYYGYRRVIIVTTLTWTWIDDRRDVLVISPNTSRLYPARPDTPRDTKEEPIPDVEPLDQDHRDGGPPAPYILGR